MSVIKDVYINIPRVSQYITDTVATPYRAAVLPSVLCIVNQMYHDVLHSDVLSAATRAGHRMAAALFLVLFHISCWLLR